VKDAIIAILFAVLIIGQGAIGPRHANIQLGTLINAQDLSASRSFSINNAILGMGIMTLLIDLTDANSSVTNLSMTCTISDTDNVTDFKMQTGSIASGTITLFDSTWSKNNPGGSTGDIVLRVDTIGTPGDTECTFSDTGGDGSDTITVRGYASSQ
jgi:hypothetical protein